MRGNLRQRSLPQTLAKGFRLVADLADEGATALGEVARSIVRPTNAHPQFRKLVVHDTPRRETLLTRARQTGRIAIVSTFHDLPFFLSYHYRLVNNLVKEGFVVYIVHVAPEVPPGLLHIENDDLFLCIKQNAGFDFGSYGVGVGELLDIWSDIDEVLLINDSIIGVASDFADLFSAVRSKEADFVGLTDSFERGYHLQTFFLWLGPRAVHSDALGAFFNNFRFTAPARGSTRHRYMVRERVTLAGELTLTRLLLAERLRGCALCPYQQVAARWLDRLPGLARQVMNLPAGTGADEASGPSFRASLLAGLDTIAADVVSGTPLNPTQAFWDVLLEDFEFPFIKRELLTANPAGVPSYFRLAEVLQRVPPEVTSDVVELCQNWGGPKVPFIAARYGDPQAFAPIPPIAADAKTTVG